MRSPETSASAAAPEHCGALERPQSLSVRGPHYNAAVIMPIMEWRRRFEDELDNAEKARARGNEGRARVCARRAAGIAIREYLLRNGRSLGSAGTLDLFEELKRRLELPADLLQRLDHLTLRVDAGFNLPENVDLIMDARLVARELLG
jgi:hypothetical protein